MLIARSDSSVAWNHSLEADGSRIAVLNSQPGENPTTEQPMPRWGWGEVKGPYQG